MTDPIKKTSDINILVLGAGTFPGYRSLLAKILQTLPQLKRVNFTLVRPGRIWFYLDGKLDLYIK